MQKIWKHLFESVLLPAVAGNILWTLSYMMLDGFEAAELPRLIMLLILGFYLLIDWLLYKSIGVNNTSWLYWSFEAVYLFAVTGTALSAQLAPSSLRWFLTGYFAVVIAGHVCGAWETDDPKGASRLKLIITNVLGLGILWLGLRYLSLGEWSIPISFALALVVWIQWARHLQWAKIEESMPG